MFRWFRSRITLGPLAACVLGLLLARPTLAENKKHHIGFAFGYEKRLSDDLDGPALMTIPGFGFPITDVFERDLSEAGLQASSYRLSIRPNLDLTLDARASASHDYVYSFGAAADMTIAAIYFGPGVRLISPAEGTRPYVQANLFFVVEETVFDFSNRSRFVRNDSSLGAGVSAGVDLQATSFFSVPIEASYIYAKPAEDVSGVGASIGLTWNFGTLR